ncbi:mRNA-degrading endonuclease YafQ (mRNA interferase), toxin component of the YafQ-DinJ toxin-antitoxin module, partial [Dysosmobacter welbionis]
GGHHRGRSRSLPSHPSLRGDHLPQRNRCYAGDLRTGGGPHCGGSRAGCQYPAGTADRGPLRRGKAVSGVRQSGRRHHPASVRISDRWCPHSLLRRRT